MLQHLEQRGLSLWLHQTIMVPRGWRHSPLWSPQRRAMETSFSLAAPPLTPLLSPLGLDSPPRSLWWETLNSRLEAVILGGPRGEGRAKNNILYSRARTAPPAHQTSNKCGYRPIKNKGRGERRGTRGQHFSDTVLQFCLLQGAA